MTELSGIELRRTIARTLGWKSWLRKRGGYTHVSWQNPGEREPWFRVQNAEDARKAYSAEPVTVIDPMKHIDYDALPHFESSLDACFAPGGPVERLRADHGLDLGMTEADTWLAVFYPMSGDEGGGSSESSNPAEAVCRAFLAAVS